MAEVPDLLSKRDYKKLLTDLSIDLRTVQRTVTFFQFEGETTVYDWPRCN